MGYSRIFAIGVLCAVISIGLTSCMRVTAKHYVDGKEEDGFVSYRAVPHLLERPTGSKDNPVAVDIIYLPSSSDRTVIDTTGFVGTAELGFALEGDMLKSFNSTVDTKVPETIGSIAGLATPLAGLAEAMIPPASESQNLLQTIIETVLASGSAGDATSELSLAAHAGPANCRRKLDTAKEAGIQLEHLYEYVGCLLSDLAGSSKEPTKAEVEKVGTQVTALRYTTQTFLDKANVHDMLLLQRTTQKISSDFDKLATETVHSHAQHTRMIKEGFANLEAVLNKAIAALVKAPSFKLYEIDVTTKKLIPIAVGSTSIGETPAGPDSSPSTSSE